MSYNFYPIQVIQPFFGQTFSSLYMATPLFILKNPSIIGFHGAYVYNFYSWFSQHML